MNKIINHYRFFHFLKVCIIFFFSQFLNKTNDLFFIIFDWKYEIFMRNFLSKLCKRNKIFHAGFSFSENSRLVLKKLLKSHIVPLFQGFFEWRCSEVYLAKKSNKTFLVFPGKSRPRWPEKLGTGQRDDFFRISIIHRNL